MASAEGVGMETSAARKQLIGGCGSTSDMKRDENYDAPCPTYTLFQPRGSTRSGIYTLLPHPLFADK